MKTNKEYLSIMEDLVQFYEVDIDNCKMSKLDFIKEMSLLICTNNHKYKLLSEIEKYKEIRENL